jgi:replicative DNA helicase
LPRVSNEAHLICAIIDTQQPEAVTANGIDPLMFQSYQSEFRWLSSYQSTYGKMPTLEALRHKFPVFPQSGAQATDVAYYADEVRYAYTRRTLTHTIDTAARHIAEDDLESAVFAVSSFAPPMYRGIELPNTLNDETFLDTWLDPIETYRVPWNTLDMVTGGLSKGELWYVAARLGQGKSWTLSEFACTLAMAGKRVLYVSLEMSERMIQQRFHVMLAHRLGVKGIKHSDLRQRTISVTDYRDLMHAVRERVPGSISVLDFSRGPVSPAKIQSMAQDYDVIVIDYVGLMTSSMGTRSVEDWRVMAAVSNQLKEVAVASDVPIIAAAQINREGETRGWMPPKVKNLAQSDALGQDGDVVITQRQYGKRAMVYSIEKNRSGEGQVLFFTHFDPNIGKFTEIRRGEADQLKDDFASERDQDDD